MKLIFKKRDSIVKIILILFSLNLLTNCSSDDELQTGNSILLFQLPINGELVNGEINQTTKLITFDVFDADVTSLKPIAELSTGAKIAPSLNLSQDFSDEVRYTVTAENGDEREYVILVKNTIRSGENFIKTFKLNVNNEIVEGVINNNDNTISCDVVGADLTSMTPSIEISDKAQITPNNGIPQDFSQPVKYIVTAENGDDRIYDVKVNNRPYSTGKSILNFTVNINGESINARINEDIKEISFETGSFDISKLTPEIEVSENATISPASGEMVDFNNPVTFTVTAENGETSTYSVKINEKFKINVSTLLGPTSGTRKLFTRARMSVNLDFLNPSIPGSKLYLDDGVNKIELPILNVTSHEFQRIISYSVSTQIPENTISSDSYKVVFENEQATLASDLLIDILAENSPKIISVNQTSYSYGDDLIIQGENLTDTIGVPSNGSFYILLNTWNIPAHLNSEKTQYTLTLTGSFINDAFFPYNSEERKVVFMTEDRRIGDQTLIKIN